MAKSLKEGNNAGHNSGATDAEALKRYVERAANVMTHQKGLGEDLKEICAEAEEAGGFTKREIRRLARESLMDQEVLTAQLERMDFLRAQLGHLADTPLGEAAVKVARTRKRGDHPPHTVEEAIDAAREHLGEA